jgi:hypothetical protein
MDAANPDGIENSRNSSDVMPVSRSIPAAEPAAMASRGRSWMSEPSITGKNGMMPPPAATSVGPQRSGSGFCRSSSDTRRWTASSSSIGTEPSPAIVADVSNRLVTSAVSRAASDSNAVAWADPLCTIARRNNPCVTDISVATLIPPADCPATVTRPGSPPNAAMFSWTHSSAAI